MNVTDRRTVSIFCNGSLIVTSTPVQSPRLPRSISLQFQVKFVFHFRDVSYSLFVSSIFFLIPVRPQVMLSLCPMYVPRLSSTPTLRRVDGSVLVITTVPFFQPDLIVHSLSVGNHPSCQSVTLDIKGICLDPFATFRLASPTDFIFLQTYL